MRKIIYFLLSLLLIFSACTKVYIPECPEDNRKKVEVAFNINTEMEVENFTRAVISGESASKEVYYRIYEKVKNTLNPILEGEHDRTEPLKLNMLEGNYKAEFFTVNSYEHTDGYITLEAVNDTHLNHVYKTELDFEVTTTPMAKEVTLNRVVSAIRFVRSSENHSKFIELKSVSITSNQTINLYSGDISNNGTWVGVVNPIDPDGQEWNYVFAGDIGFKVTFYAENGHKNYTLTRENIKLDPNKKYTVIISRNNTDGIIKDNSFEIKINEGWDKEENIPL